MTAQLEQDLTAPGGALNEANKTISDGKEKLKTSIDEMIHEVSTDFFIESNHYRWVPQSNCLILRLPEITIIILSGMHYQAT